MTTRTPTWMSEHQRPSRSMLWRKTKSFTYVLGTIISAAFYR